MKNIHVLPTDKPSRVFITKDEGLGFDYQILGNTELDCQNQNIYITSDEKIKEGDWCFLDQPLENGFPNHQEVFQNKDDSDYLNMVNHLVKKIILTTNIDLIKDGVQAIDDEFLEWFVNNPSCEEVETEKWFDTSYIDLGIGKVYHNNPTIPLYKIIIPKEEHSKQIKCYCGHTTTSDCGPEKPKQETLEQAPKEKLDFYQQGFADGFKIQQERSYSKGDMLQSFLAGIKCESKNGKNFEQFIKQFKNK